ncbi:hypothetical protein CK203_065975 [Vitis vinifera]|uniref:Uncharacterized protein n=1 Tax=Vitis vinifera TaxID=29760 RepID=A0A438G3I1_VITVI|nr:hypothetical protein CK203_065975 [Vitis vinifera]
MTPPQFFYPRVALDFYQSMTTHGVPVPASILFTIDGRQGILGARQIVEAFHIPFAPADPAAFRRWAPLSEWDMVHPHSEHHRHCRESFSLDQWNQVWLHQHSPELPEPREVPPAPSTSAPSEPVPEQHRLTPHLMFPPTSKSPITIPGTEYHALLVSFLTLTTTQTAIMERMDHFQLRQDQQTLILHEIQQHLGLLRPAPPVAVPSTVAAEHPSYPLEEPTT